MSNGGEKGEANAALSGDQMERIKRNREKAKSIRQARLESHPYDINQRRPASSRELDSFWRRLVV